jgi:hypothetical protein
MAKTAMQRLKETAEDMNSESFGNRLDLTAILLHINTWALELERMQIEDSYRDGHNDANLFDSSPSPHDYYKEKYES